MTFEIVRTLSPKSASALKVTVTEPRPLRSATKVPSALGVTDSIPGSEETAETAPSKMALAPAVERPTTDNKNVVKREEYL